MLIPFLQEVQSRFLLLEGELQPVGMGRYSLLLFGLSIFKENPIFGAGFNQFAEYYRSYHGELRYAHNTYLSILVELGLVGLTIYLLFYWTLLKSLYASAKNNSGDDAWIAQSFLIILLAEALQIASLSAISNSSIWMSFALAAILILKNQEERRYSL